MERATPDTPLADLNQGEKKVYSAVERLAGRSGVNEMTVAYSCPGVDVFGILRALVQRGLLERTSAGAVRIASPIVPLAPPSVIRTVAEPIRKPPKPPRKYFAHLNPKKDFVKQIASRIVQYLAAEGYRVRYMCLYHSLHGTRYRDFDGRDIWLEALLLLGIAVRRQHGFIWLDRETRLVSKLPWPYTPELRPRKKRPRSRWYLDVAARAEANGLTISEQIAADRETRSS